MKLLIDSNAVKGLNKVGDIFAPGDHEFPKFSELGCIEHIDRALAYMPEQDVKDLNMLLGVFSFLPTFILKMIFSFLEWIFENDLPVPGVVRIIRLGVRGLVMTLYWSGFKGRNYTGKSPNELIGFQIGVYDGDQPLANR